MNLSLCCISLILQEQGHKFQTMTYSRFKTLRRDQALTILSERILNNFKVTNRIIQHCNDVGIRGYRMSSSLVPVLNHPDVNLKLTDLPNVSDIFAEFENIKNTIRLTGIRVSAHPGEYTTLSSTNEIAVQNSIRDLEQHGELFDYLDLPKDYNSPLNIHCRQDGDAVDISERFKRNFDRLSDSVKSRLTLEVNDNVNGTWHIPNLIEYFHKSIHTPITFDTLHWKFCHGGLTEQQAFDAAYATWNTVPVFHFSDGINNTRSHADYTDKIPNDFGKPVYWDVELKAKDLAIKRILERLTL